MENLVFLIAKTIMSTRLKSGAYQGIWKQFIWPFFNIAVSRIEPLLVFREKFLKLISVCTFTNDMWLNYC